ncbi:tetratricopeptide repeat protein [Deefgea piscis]|uniref:tetratricopeptide repeat protein n=1 Tax=Deefgea piscis TaxID=2739061 RepID=UPI001C7F3F2B|nr:tetratricopeptide repeat protein [Deefgea piscis]QZA80485.1 tetratricopeptide repeat protein [Deefgea piscis]
MNSSESQVLALLERSKQLTYSEPNTSLALATEAAQLAKTGCTPRLQIAASHQQMSMLFAFGQIHEGCHALLPALVIAEAHDLEAERGDLLHHLGVAHYTLGEYSTAIDYWSDCLDLGNAQFANETRINAHIGLGQIYFACSRFADALRHHRQAESRINAQTDHELQARLCINLVADLYALEDFAAAQVALNKAEAITRTIQHLEYLGEVFSYKSLLALTRGEYLEANAYIQEGRHIVHFWAWGEISWHIVHGRTQQTQGQLSSAVASFMSALDMSKRMGCGHKIFLIHQFLAGLFREMGQAPEAEYHHRLYQENFHRLLDPQLFARLAQLEQQLLQSNPMTPSTFVPA